MSQSYDIDELRNQVVVAMEMIPDATGDPFDIFRDRRDRYGRRRLTLVWTAGIVAVILVLAFASPISLIRGGSSRVPANIAAATGSPSVGSPVDGLVALSQDGSLYSIDLSTARLVRIPGVSVPKSDMSDNVHLIGPFGNANIYYLYSAGFGTAHANMFKINLSSKTVSSIPNVRFLGLSNVTPNVTSEVEVSGAGVSTFVAQLFGGTSFLQLGGSFGHGTVPCSPVILGAWPGSNNILGVANVSASPDDLSLERIDADGQQCSSVGTIVSGGVPVYSVPVSEQDKVVMLFENIESSGITMSLATVALSHPIGIFWRRDVFQSVKEITPTGFATTSSGAVNIISLNSGGLLILRQRIGGESIKEISDGMMSQCTSAQTDNAFLCIADATSLREVFPTGSMRLLRGPSGGIAALSYG
jgi:hypothetical protein